MPNLAPLVSKLSLDPREYISGLDKAESRLKSFTSTAGKGLQNFAAGNSAGIFTDPLKSGLTALPGGGMIASAVSLGETFTRSIQETSNRIADASKTSDKLGLSYNTLLAIQSAAGDSADALSGALGHLSKEIYAAGAGSTEAQAKFGRLGLDWQQLASSSPENQIRLVADRIKDAGGPTNKLALEMELLGKRGVELDNVFSKGSAGIDVWRQRVEESGRALSDNEARMIRFEQAQQKIAKERIEGIKSGLAFNKNRFDLAMQEEMKGSIFEGASQLAPGVLGLFGRPSQASFDKVDAMTRKLAGNNRENDPTADAAIALGTSIKAAEEILRKQIDTMGKGAEASRRWELATRGATDAELKNFDALQKQLGAKQFTESVRGLDAREAHKIRDLQQNPLSQAQTDLGRINMLQAKGLLTDEERVLAIGQLGKKFMDLGQTRLPAALTEGSAAAFSAIARNESRGSTGDIQQQIKDGINRAAELQKATLIEAQKIVEAVKENGFKQAR